MMINVALIIHSVSFLYSHNVKSLGNLGVWFMVLDLPQQVNPNPKVVDFFKNAVCLKMDGIPNGLPSFWNVNTKHQTLK